MSEELKPCPFCGGEATLFQIKCITHSNGGAGMFQVKCVNLQCNVSPKTMYESSKDEAIVAWNRRANDE